MHTKESIQLLLDRNPNAVIRALYFLHGQQTTSEQAYGAAHEANRRGFNRYDAPLLTDYVRQMNAGRKLSEMQLSIARKKVKRYWRQLVETANEKIQAEQAVATPALPVAPIIASVSAERLDYRRYDPRCLCENFDGERLCDWCEERQFDGLILEAERREEEEQIAADRGSW